MAIIDFRVYQMHKVIVFVTDPMRLNSFRCAVDALILYST